MINPSKRAPWWRKNLFNICIVATLLLFLAALVFYSYKVFCAGYRAGVNSERNRPTYKAQIQIQFDGQFSTTLIDTVFQYQIGDSIAVYKIFDVPVLQNNQPWDFVATKPEDRTDTLGQVIIENRIAVIKYIYSQK